MTRINILLLVLALIAIISAGMPFYFGWTYESNHTFRMGEYGSWLQAVLTPISIVAATIGFLLQAETQKQANKYLLMGTVMSNLRMMEGHLNYLAFCAWSGARRDVKSLEGEPLKYVQMLAEKPEYGFSAEHTTRLRDELRRVVQLARQSGTDQMLDGRVLNLATKLGCDR
jgi:hypothetical protein